MISTVVLTKNEQRNIKECLSSLSWCDEVIVIDDFSNDKTAEFAKDLGAKVYQHHLNNDFASQRNFGLKQARGEWVLFIDADERISPQLAEEIKNLYLKTTCSGFNIKRVDYLWGKAIRFGETGNVRLLRFGKRNLGVWKRKVHEFWEIKGSIGEFKNPIQHFPHQTVDEFLQEINFYSTLHAQALKEEGAKTSFFLILLNPLGKFIVNWVFKLGFLDGMPGFIIAIMMSFHSFLARAKLYLKWKK